MKVKQKIRFLMGGAITSIIILPLVTSCSIDDTHPDLDRYYNSVGTDWYGYKSGSLNLLLDDDTQTATIVRANNYAAKDLLIPKNIIDKQTNKTYTLTKIGSKVFEENQDLKGTITFPNTLKVIGDSAFKNVTWVSGDLIIPNSVTDIKNNAFTDSGFSGKLVLGNGLKEIGDLAFYDCEHLRGNLVIPDSVLYVGPAAFSGCESMDGTLTLSNSLTEISPSTFYNDQHLHGTLTIGDKIDTIGNYAFEWCANFSGTLDIPDSVSEIGTGAFHGCSGILRISIPDSVTEIKNDAFDEMSTNLNLRLLGCTNGDPTTTYSGSVGDIINPWWNNGNPQGQLELKGHIFPLNLISWINHP